MQTPNINNVMRDEANNITFNVMAYRKLTKEEMTIAVRVFRSTKQGRRPKKNTTYTLISIIGFND